jgi:hypothetical protein
VEVAERQFLKVAEQFGPHRHQDLLPDLGHDDDLAGTRHVVGEVDEQG